MSPPPTNYPGAGGQSGPKKETARISILPEPVTPRAPTVKMTKTQPLIAAPQAKVHSAPVSVAKVPAATAASTGISDLVDLLDTVPMPVCWIIFGISSLTLLIQIWNYVSA